MIFGDLSLENNPVPVVGRHYRVAEGCGSDIPTAVNHGRVDAYLSAIIIRVGFTLAWLDYAATTYSLTVALLDTFEDSVVITR